MNCMSKDFRKPNVLVVRLVPVHPILSLSQEVSHRSQLHRKFGHQLSTPAPSMP